MRGKHVWWQVDEWGEDGAVVTYVVVEGRWWVPTPSKLDRNPVDWWHLEAITGIAAGRFGGADHDTRKAIVEDVVARLELARGEVAGVVSPVLDGGLDGWRRWIVHTRFVASGGLLKPYCFTARSGSLPDRALALMADALGPGLGLFRQTLPEGSRLAVVDWSSGRSSVLVARDTDTCAALLRRSVNFCRTGYPPQQTGVPRAVAAELRTLVPTWLPELAGVSRLPVLSASGDYRPRGYDASSRLLVDPDWDPAVVALDSGLSSLETALHRVLWPFSDFPLVDGWGPLLALLLEPVVRPLTVAANRPLWVVDAPAGGQGTGKSLLAQCMSALAAGRSPDVMTLPTSETEVTKCVTAVVRRQKSVQILDNVTGTVRSDALAALATSTVWAGRTLGASDAPSVPLVTTWVLTSNGARLSRDLARRCVFVRLDAGRAVEPSRRTGFKVNQLLAYCLDAGHRASVVTALTELTRAWLVAGRPGPSARLSPFGSFEGWLRVTGGLLTWLDEMTGERLSLVAGLDRALKVGASRDSDAGDDRLFLSGWLDTFGTSSVVAADLAALAETLGLYPAVLEKRAAAAGSWKARYFARDVLARLTDRGIDVHPDASGGTSDEAGGASVCLTVRGSVRVGPNGKPRGFCLEVRETSRDTSSEGIDVSQGIDKS